VFDPRRIRDRATFAEPSLPSEGISHVLVNGTVVLEQGKYTGAKRGAADQRRTAISHGVPVVSSDVGGVRHVVDEPEALFPAGDLFSVKRMVQRWLSLYRGDTV
jgi:glycosyltransferase involved in cell wall biosynthesis